MTNALVGLGVRPTSAMGLNFIPNTFVDAFYILLYSPGFSEIVKLVRVLSWSHSKWEVKVLFLFFSE